MPPTDEVLRIGRFALSERGLTVAGEPTPEEWDLALARLKTIDDGAIQWGLGDLLNYGSQEYGRKYEAAANPAQAKTWRNYAYVAERFAVSRRRDNLPWSFHAEVAALARPQADRFLDKAQRESWTRQQLRAAVRAKRQAELEAIGPAVFDLLGQPVPDDWCARWAATADLLKRHAALTASLVVALSEWPWAPEIGRLRDGLEAVEALGPDHAPYCICPRCDAEAPEMARCALCAGRGWLTRYGLESVPDPDYRRANRFGGARKSGASPKPSSA